MYENQEMGGQTLQKHRMAAAVAWNGRGNSAVLLQAGKVKWCPKDLGRSAGSEPKYVEIVSTNDIRSIQSKKKIPSKYLNQSPY